MFETFEAVMMVLLFLVPGYIWRATESRIAFVQKRLPWEELALGLFVRSAILYIPTAPWLYRVYELKSYDTQPVATVLVSLLLLVILPIICGLIAGIESKYNGLNRLLEIIKIPTLERRREPTAWDAVFGNLKTCFVVATLKSGRVVRGYAGKSSHFSVGPEQRDIYLSHVLKSNEDLLAPGTEGIYIGSDDIETIEFIAKPD